MTTSPLYFPNLANSTLKKKLLGYYFTNSEAKHYVRELAAYLNVDPTNLSRELRRLEKEGIFVSEKRGLQKYFSINKHYALYDEFKSTVFKTVGVQGTLREMLNGFSDIELAFIYGSYAKNEEGMSSDIDLVIVGNPDRKRLTSEINMLESKLEREINFNVYARSS
jgi:predicted nucleotidyltransferase